MVLRLVGAQKPTGDRMEAPHSRRDDSVSSRRLVCSVVQGGCGSPRRGCLRPWRGGQIMDVTAGELTQCDYKHVHGSRGVAEAARNIGNSPGRVRKLWTANRNTYVIVARRRVLKARWNGGRRVGALVELGRLSTWFRRGHDSSDKVSARKTMRKLRQGCPGGVETLKLLATPEEALG